MTPDTMPGPAASELQPAASLTSVRVKRRKPLLQPSGKRGDLTASATTPPPAVLPPVALPEAPSPSVIILPPPAIDRQTQQESLPFVEIMLPELASEAANDAALEAAPAFEAVPDEVLETAPTEELETAPTEETADEAEPEAAPSLTFAPAPPPDEPETLDLLLWSAPEAEPPPPALEPDAPEPMASLSALLEPEPSAPESPAEPHLERSVAIMAPEPEAPAPPRREPNLVIVAPEPPPPPEPPLAVAPPMPEPPERAEPLLAAPPAPMPAEEAAPAAIVAVDILDYWDSLRGGRDFPSLDELDRAHVGTTWPNTVLLAVTAAELPRITRLGESDGAIEYTDNVIDWLMARGRVSAKRGEPMEEERRFPVSTGVARYRLLMLPLSSFGLNCDHVLCQLAPVPELGAVASFKRWLAS